eukprot:TRINITY_DN24005_c0_g1_i1.p1 TRINITY_DN24005_c0_g1~~TRINITY_DN24005_c0_g1_i1.p1  ORF type:complete len:486 (+),score=89.01 TRINITY_DN24005_c0_g1_i1:34-1491(+)
MPPKMENGGRKKNKKKKKRKKARPEEARETPVKEVKEERREEVELISPSSEEKPRCSTPRSPLSPVEIPEADVIEWDPVITDRAVATRRRSRSLLTMSVTDNGRSSLEESECACSNASEGSDNFAPAFKAWSKMHSSSSSAMLVGPDNRFITPLTSPAHTFAVKKHVATQMDWLQKGGLKKRSQSTGKLPSENFANPMSVMHRRTFFGEYSDETRRLLKQRTNSHFLPISRDMLKADNTNAVQRFLRNVVLYLLESVKLCLMFAAVYLSFYDIKFITKWNPYLKIAHYSGRMLFPLLDTLLGVAAADLSLWLGGQIGFYRALGRLSGTYRKFEAGIAPPQSAETLEVTLYYAHWVLDFLYFPTEHLGLVEWKIFGVKTNLFFSQMNAVVWYWRQVLQMCLLLHAVSNQAFAVSSLALFLYSLNLFVDMLTAYAFLPPYAPGPKCNIISVVYSFFCTRRFAIGLGTHGLLGVADGVIQIILRYQFS